MRKRETKGKNAKSAGRGTTGVSQDPASGGPAWTSILLLSGGIVAACANEYTYGPAMPTEAMIDGAYAVEYTIPAARGGGELGIAFMGISDVAALLPGGSRKALHLRVAARNHGDKAWTLDAQDAQLLFPDGVRLDVGGSRAAPGPTVIQVLGGRQAAMDLYFPVPMGSEAELSAPTFRVRWILHADGRVIEGEAPFDRQLVNTDDESEGHWGGSTSPSR
jgi:hypothetical protein